MIEPKYTSAWRGSKGEIFYRPLSVNPKDFFEGYTMPEFKEKLSNPDCFPLPTELIPAAHALNGNNCIVTKTEPISFEDTEKVVNHESS